VGRHGVMAGLVALVAVLFAQPAFGADPGRWTETGHSTVPIYYYQGVTSDPARNFFFDGVHVGLYRTDSQLNETGRNDDVIPPDVHAREGYNHIGDISWDDAEGGRVLLPLECYYPPAGNTCNTGSIGVADPAALRWRYYVKLDPAEIPKAMWNEVSPDGQLIWTSSGNDLLAYRTADVNAANAAPAGPVIKAVRRLSGAVPPSGITGATFYGGRLYVAGQQAAPGPGDLFQVWSIDLATGQRRLEIERTLTGESEGLDVNEALGGVLHWLVQPYNEENIPTYGVTNGTLLHFAPANQPPNASFTYSPASPRVRDNVTFTSTSSDPDGSIASQAWDLDNDGQFDDGTGGTASRSFDKKGSYVVRLRVTDDQGAAAVASRTITVSNPGGR
jgi:hypothetical protein